MAEGQDSINKKGRGQGRKRLGVLQSYRLCTYCDLNLDENSLSENPKRKNMKAHIALNHAQQICVDKGLKFDTEDGVDNAEFLVQLHFINKVHASIEGHHYSIMQACRFFEVMNREVLHPDASEDEKAQCYRAFLDEAKEAFRKYRVMYLRGISVPSSYNDLLPVPKTTYKDVCWKGIHPPRSNKFYLLLTKTDLIQISEWVLQIL